MEKPATVKELFLPLGDRLFYFESDIYLNKSHVYYDHFGERTFSYESLINEIGKFANLFTASDVYFEAIAYDSRVKAMLSNLKPTEIEFATYDLEGNFYTEPIEEVTNEKRKRILFDRYKKELAFYLKGLNSIIKIREQNALLSTNTPFTTSDNSMMPTPAPIQLPPSFKVGDLNKKAGFYAKISSNSIALLFHIMKEKEIIPNYNQTSLGILGQSLFGRSLKEISDALKAIHSVKKSKEDLKDLKSTLLLIIEQLEEFSGSTK